MDPGQVASHGVFHRTFAAMGTRFTLVLPGCAPARGTELVSLARDLVDKHESALSRFRPDSPIAELNACAGGTALPLDDLVWSVLCFCREHHLRTRGAFDPALLPLLRFWEQSSMAQDEEHNTALEKARALSGMELLHLDPKTRRGLLLRPGAGLDLGGVGKGIAVDAVQKAFMEHGVNSALLSFGESSLFGLGAPPGLETWQLSLDPRYRLKAGQGQLFLKNVGMSCSSTRRFAERTSRSLNLDPRKGRPVTGERCLVVTSPCAAEAEILSSALLALQPGERSSVLSSYPQIQAFEVRAPSDADGCGEIIWSHPS